ncbi:MAG: DUF4859 domain-containing protein [Fibrobacter sp.]|nr:DUF4859 domain-containing protein [Fibrobacter sp.]
MKILKLFRLLALAILLLNWSAFATKQVYIPRFVNSDNGGKSVEDSDAQWSYSRSVQTANWIIFWEPGFGADPSTASGSYKVNMENLKQVIEKSYAHNVDSLKMVIKGQSKTDTYKMMIFLLYSTEWAAYGSGADELVGVVHVNPAAANGNTVMAHEIGQCFQYMTGVDSPQGGFRYGFGNNGAGGNGYWEQMAQWQAFKVYPEEQFRAHDFRTYIASNHKHLIHEEPRYANYFIGDFWAYKRGLDFQGKLWRDSRSPEDPIEAYKRLNNVNQVEFNAEMYEHAARLTTWDLPAIKTYGANYIDSRAQVKMNDVGDGYWRVDASVAPENYGYNSIKLNAPGTASTVSVHFQGLAGQSGYRSLNVDKAGWRFGFVALLNNGERDYSEMGSLDYASGANPEGSLSYAVPSGCSKLWLVVSGSPQEYWRHEWDDDDSNDEQWPYQVKFAGTNLLGQQNATGTKTFTLTATVEGSGGSVNPASGSFMEGTMQTITAVPQEGYRFVSWGGDASGNINPLNITMDGNKTLTATFAEIPIKTLNFEISMEPAADYEAVEVALGDSLAELLGISAFEISAAWGHSLKYYALDNGALNANSTANDPGHWFDSDGQVVAWGDNARIYSEMDANKLVAQVGQYPNRSSVGDSYSFTQVLVYEASPNAQQINLNFKVNIGAGTVKLSSQIAKESITEVRVYSLQGQLLHRINSAETGSLRHKVGPGVYRLVEISGRKIVRSSMLNNL